MCDVCADVVILTIRFVRDLCLRCVYGVRDWCVRCVCVTAVSVWYLRLCDVLSGVCVTVDCFCMVCG